MESVRFDNRKPAEMRSVSIVADVNPYAEGSAQVSFGNTKVLVSATVERELPNWLKDKNTGWITAEYGMLPRSTHTRNQREASSGKQSGRIQEIQRLIGRALRQSVDLVTLHPLLIRLDCDVIVADGGTRTAAISGAWVALNRSISWAVNKGILASKPQMHQVAAVSVGRVNGRALLDLCYEEDANAEFDLNLVCRNDNKIIEIQGCGEKASLTLNEIVSLSELAQAGCEQIFAEQQYALERKVAPE